jgi:antitoxin component of MazEF toxin-antitoxin module
MRSTSSLRSKPGSWSFTATIIKIGNGLGIRIPRRIVREAGLRAGDKVRLTFEFRKGSGVGIRRGAAPFAEEEDSHQDII